MTFCFSLLSRPLACNNVFRFMVGRLDCIVACGVFYQQTTYQIMLPVPTCFMNLLSVYCGVTLLCMASPALVVFN